MPVRHHRLPGRVAATSVEEVREEALDSLDVGRYRPRREDLKVGTELFGPLLCHSQWMPPIAGVADDEDL